MLARFGRLLFVGILLIGNKPILAAQIETLVIVPNATGAAKQIYDQVVKGIVSNNELNTSVIKINKETKPEWLKSEITKRQAVLVIPIGNTSYRLCNKINNNFLKDVVIVAGGISGKPNGIPTLSLTGNARSTLEHIKHYSPKVKDVRLVYNEDMNGWWYKQALEAAEDLDITIIGYRADDIKQGVRLYEKLISEANSKSSAVWIPLKSIIPSKTILPLLLEKAWAKKLPVISNNPSHTRLGGLMALYPEHVSMGKQLAEFAIGHHKGVEKKRIIGTKNLRIAINLRTSSHLGLRFSKSDKAAFNKIFPVKR